MGTIKIYPVIITLLSKKFMGASMKIAVRSTYMELSQLKIEQGAIAKWFVMRLKTNSSLFHININEDSLEGTSDPEWNLEWLLVWAEDPQYTLSIEIPGFCNDELLKKKIETGLRVAIDAWAKKQRK